MNVPGKMCLIMSKDKSLVFMLRMSLLDRDINILLGRRTKERNQMTQKLWMGRREGQRWAVRSSNLFQI